MLLQFVFILWGESVARRILAFHAFWMTILKCQPFFFLGAVDVWVKCKIVCENITQSDCNAQHTTLVSCYNDYKRNDITNVLCFNVWSCCFFWFSLFPLTANCAQLLWDVHHLTQHDFLWYYHVFELADKRWDVKSDPRIRGHITYFHCTARVELQTNFPSDWDTNNIFSPTQVNNVHKTCRKWPSLSDAVKKDQWSQAIENHWKYEIFWKPQILENVLEIKVRF